MHGYLSLPGNLAGADWDIEEIIPIKFLSVEMFVLAEKQSQMHIYPNN